MKPFTKISAGLFGLVAVIHVIRLFYPYLLDDYFLACRQVCHRAFTASPAVH